MLFGIAALAFLVLLYAATAERLNRWSISMPLIFVAGGLVLNSLGVFPLTLKYEGIKELTEITLALLLFADASTLNLRQVGLQRLDERHRLKRVWSGRPARFA